MSTLLVLYWIINHVLGDSMLYYTHFNKSLTCIDGIVHFELTIDWRQKKSNFRPDTVVVAANKGILQSENFTNICQIQLPPGKCGSKNSTECFCSFSNDSITVMSIQFRATPDISKAGFLAYFLHKGTFGLPLDTLYLHQIYGQDSATLTMNGIPFDLNFCNVSVTPNTRLRLKFCAHNLSGNAQLYRIYRSSLLCRYPGGELCLIDEILVTEEHSHFELGYIDQCQRTAAFYCAIYVFSESEPQECSFCKEDSVGELIVFVMISVLASSILAFAICYIKINMCRLLVPDEFDEAEGTNTPTPSPKSNTPTPSPKSYKSVEIFRSSDRIRFPSKQSKSPACTPNIDIETKGGNILQSDLAQSTIEVDQQ
ncbi:hypothetical protein Bpfe_000687 [Biomphalaria pfeifferi]|uniref:Uncharacterized protein n=1 Tax=Biomphalaria pfeifferi TaxID=112525 RepID=A0AAD8CCI5_BIOPF|nr:hypothetical protein Bpfe_000687 [Biomphalaria pfeifferi]